MNQLKKARVTLANVPLSATSPVVWRFVTGVAPYVATFTVHQTQWDQTLKNQMGQPVTLRIEDGRGNTQEVKDLFILHRVPSDSPYRVSFVVADKRWKWPYKLVARDFNVARKTGDRTAKQTVPIETAVVVDKYDYLAYSLNESGEKWTAEDAIEHVLNLLNDDKEDRVKIESFPIKDGGAGKKGKGNGGGGNETGQFSLQNVVLRDAGDAALSRLLSYVPGADVYVDAKGVVTVFDATDLDELETYYKGLPEGTYDGDFVAWVEREQIRPEKVILYYQREVEVLFDYSDTLDGTSASPGRNYPYLENVIPTVDTTTTITEFDPELGKDVSKEVPPGTWVRFDRWLAAMDEEKPEGSLPWTFDTIKRHWLKGDLDAVLGAGGLDRDDEANVAMRVQALKQHFRQTFRINRRYMERIRRLQAVRVALLDPVTGARAPAAVWGQACIIPTTKGARMASRKDPGKAGVYRNVDYLAPSVNGAEEIIDTAPGPAAVELVDRDLGIFRVQWILSPYGDVASFIPCHLVGSNNKQVVVSRDLSKQDEQPMGPGIQVESGTNGIFLRGSLDMKVLLTITPNAPNNERQFHRHEVEPKDVADVFKKEFRIDNGKGPTLEVFVPPGEMTARFALESEQNALSTLIPLLGYNSDDPEFSGLDDTELKGYVLSNGERLLPDHALSYATELLAPYADSVQGTVVTSLPKDGVSIKGNMGGAAVRVSSAPGAKVDAVHSFPGQQRPLSRFALMSAESRAVVLGVLPIEAEK